MRHWLACSVQLAETEFVPPIAAACLGQVACSRKPIVAGIHLIAHKRPPGTREPRSHGTREHLLARLALPPHSSASVSPLRKCFLDEAPNVREAGIGSARASGLDRRRVRIQAYNAQ